MGPDYKRTQYTCVQDRTKDYHAWPGVLTVLFLNVLPAPSTVPGPWWVLGEYLFAKTMKATVI